MRSSTLLTALAFATLASGCANGAATGSTDSSAVDSRVRVTSVSVTPNPDTVLMGGTVQLRATAKSSSGTVLTGRATNWQINDTTLARISSAGLVTGRSPGLAHASATVGGATGWATIVINAAPAAAVATVAVSPSSLALVAGQAGQLSATTQDASGATLTGRAVSWSSSNPAVAAVSGTGAVSAVAAGSATIVATSEGKTGSATVSVTAPTPPPPTPVASVSVSPASLALTTGGAAGQLSATTKDANGATLTGRTLAWTTSNAAVATVSATGAVSPVAAGTASIVATSEGKSGSASVTVTAPTPPPPAPVATVSVTPATLALTVGQGGQLSAATKDANGATLTGRSIAWTSSNGAVASVNGSGYVTAVGAGSASITATSEGKAGSAAITVSAPTSTATVDTIFYDGFEGGNTSKWNDEAQPANHAIVTTGVYAGTRSLQMTLPAGSDAGWLTRFFMPGYDSVFVRWHVKLESNWTSGMKMANLSGSRIDNQWSAFGKAGQCPTGSDFFNAFLTGEPSPSMLMHFYTYRVGMPKSGTQCWGDIGPSSVYTPSSFQLAPGSWHTIEMWVKLNTPGQANGVQQFWVDGVLHGSWSGLTFRTTTDLRLNSFGVIAQSDYVNQTQRVWVDDVVVTKQKLEP